MEALICDPLAMNRISLSDSELVLANEADQQADRASHRHAEFRGSVPSGGSSSLLYC